jgi:signal transduction histidine kinase
MVVAVVAVAACVRRRPPSIARLSVATLSAAAVSLAATAVYSGPGGADAGVMGTIETAALTVLTVLIVRRAPARIATIIALVTTLAVAVSLLRLFEPSSPAAALLMCAFWALPGACGAGLGAYLRSLDAARVRAAAAARRAQRLELACDLHDFVAHDLTGMLVQAQAARVVIDQDPAAAATALDRIVEIGQHALATTDRTVHMLRDSRPEMPDQAGGLSPALEHDLTDLPGLAARFTGPARVELNLDPGLDPPLRLGNAIYRVVTEALTNVQRHATNARTVCIDVRRRGSRGLTVAVTNDLAPAAPASRRGGLGLLGLAERVEALGGTFSAGRGESGKWRVEATFDDGGGAHQ